MRGRYLIDVMSPHRFNPAHLVQEYHDLIMEGRPCSVAGVCDLVCISRCNTFLLSRHQDTETERERGETDTFESRAGR